MLGYVQRDSLTVWTKITGRENYVNVFYDVHVDRPLVDLHEFERKKMCNNIIDCKSAI